MSTIILGIASFYPVIVAIICWPNSLTSAQYFLWHSKQVPDPRAHVVVLTILPGGEPPKPTQSPPGGFLLMGDRSKAPLLDWQPHTYSWWEQLTQQGEFQPLGPARGCYPQRHGNVGSRTPKDASGRGVSAVGPGPCAPGTFGIHSDRNFQDQTQPLTRECIFSQILFVTPDISPSDSQITCCLFITMLCMEFQEVQAAAAQPSLHISHSRALSLILKFIFYMITS